LVYIYAPLNNFDEPQRRDLSKLALELRGRKF